MGDTHHTPILSHGNSDNFPETGFIGKKGKIRIQAKTPMHKHGSFLCLVEYWSLRIN